MDNQHNDLDKQAMAFKRLFDTVDGKDVLKILERRYEKPPLITNAVDGQAMTNMTNFRIGEQNVVKFIKSMIDKEIGNNE